jgi:hypothetical protein
MPSSTSTNVLRGFKVDTQPLASFPLNTIAISIISIWLYLFLYFKNI